MVFKQSPPFTEAQVPHQLEQEYNGQAKNKFLSDHMGRLVEDTFPEVSG